MFKNLQFLLLCITVILLSTPFASAKTIVVDTTSESPLYNCNDDPLFPTKCRLRSAIAKAAPGDTVTFNNSLSGSTITLIYGELTISKNLTIDGDLDNDQLPDITIDADKNSRVFRISGSLSSVKLDGLIIDRGYLSTGGLGGGAAIIIGNSSVATIENSTIIHGDSYVIAGGGIENGSGILFIHNCSLIGNEAPDGGAISNFGSMYISDSMLRFNESQGEGGGIYNHAGSYLYIYNTVFSSNVSIKYTTSSSPIYSGGGITNQGELIVVGSTFNSNRVQEAYSHVWPEIGFGGGIFNNGGTATIKRTTFKSNDAESGGGIMNNGALKLMNSTFSENFSADNGGGLFSSTSGLEATLEIRNCTFYDNWSFDGLGGGIYLYDAGSSKGEHISNTIIAASTYEDCYIRPGRGGFETNTSNLFEDGSCSPAFSGDSLLGELAFYGGPTKTHSLLPGSPAINTGSNDELPFNMTSDQRGEGFPRIHDETVDIGAYEFKKSHFFVIPHSGGKAVIFSL